MTRRARRATAPRLIVVAFVAALLAGCGSSTASPSPRSSFVFPSLAASPSTAVASPSRAAPSSAPTTPTPASPTAAASAAPSPSAPAASPSAPSASASPTAAATASAPAATIDWEPCAQSADFECGTLAVPLDEASPGPETIQLALVRLRAGNQTARIGSLLVNPGGPGASGVDFVLDAAALFSEDLRARFDLIGFDPRGVGLSSPVECYSDEELDQSIALDPTPDTSAERDALIEDSRDFVAACVRNSGPLLPFMSTEQAARDMDRIRAAVGDDKLTYLGFSYGTFLGSTYARLFPDRIRALVLDGAVDATQPFETEMRTQAEGFQQALDAFFDDCQTSGNCQFSLGVRVRQQFDALMARIDRQPLPATAIDDPRLVGPGEAFTGVRAALYSRDQWPILAQGLELARRGDGSLLLLLADNYTSRDPNGHYSNLFAANSAVNCADLDVPTDIAVFDAMVPVLEAIAPAFGEAIAYSGLTCAFWPLHPAAPPPVPTAPGAPPIVVVGTTGDPATPYTWAVNLAEQLESGVLLTYEGEGHTAYGAGNACIVSAVDTYLIDLVPPEDGTRCT